MQGREHVPCPVQQLPVQRQARQAQSTRRRARMHRKSGEDPSQTAQAEMPLFQYCRGEHDGQVGACV